MRDTLDQRNHAGIVGNGRDAVARRLTERVALAMQGALLVRHALQEVAGAFRASRLHGDAGVCFGTLPAGAALARIVERAWPSP
ncbi:MAG: hypothetical protein ACOY5V_00095 [Pseudomonadota bacterium]